MEEQIICLLKSLEDQGEISEKEKNDLYLSGSKAGVLEGVPCTRRWNTIISSSFISNMNIYLQSTIPDKIFGTKWSNPVKLDRKRKVWYLFLHVF